MQGERFTEHFTVWELTRSGAAIRAGLDNVPNHEQFENLKALCENVLEPLRIKWGKPILVCGGFRTPEVNKLVQGAPGSQHLKGMAADLMPVDRKDFDDLYECAKRFCTYDQIIHEYNKSDGKDRCIHISSFRDVKNNRLRVIDRLTWPR